MVFEHCRRAISCLLWKLWHQTLNSRSKRLRSGGSHLAVLRSLTAVATAAASAGNAVEGDCAAEGSAEFAQHFVNWISNRRRAAARKQERHGIVLAIVRDDQRTRIATRTERAAIDHHLVGVGDGELLTGVASLLILNADARIDGRDRSSSEAGRASALRDCHADC